MTVVNVVNVGRDRVLGVGRVIESDFVEPKEAPRWKFAGSPRCGSNSRFLDRVRFA
jgi:hypothetical protein